MDIDFECTSCGKCCHDLRLPLTVAEALAWIDRGDEVQVLCEGLPWPEEPAAADLQLAHKRRRSFATHSGALPARVVTILAGAFVGPCPNLGSDSLCGIYADRPLVCRIYPAEINPFIEMQPASKQCPPEAWTPGRPPLMRAGRLVDATMLALIEASRAADARDVDVKQRVCAALGIDAAALSNEGFAVYSPSPVALHAALSGARDDANRAGETLPGWRFVSNRRASVEVLRSVGAVAEYVERAPEDATFAYLGFFAATP